MRGNDKYNILISLAHICRYYINISISPPLSFSLISFSVFLSLYTNSIKLNKINFSLLYWQFYEEKLPGSSRVEIGRKVIGERERLKETEKEGEWERKTERARERERDWEREGFKTFYFSLERLSKTWERNDKYLTLFLHFSGKI